MTNEPKCAPLKRPYRVAGVIRPKTTKPGAYSSCTHKSHPERHSKETGGEATCRLRYRTVLGREYSGGGGARLPSSSWSKRGGWPEVRCPAAKAAGLSVNVINWLPQRARWRALFSFHCLSLFRNGTQWHLGPPASWQNALYVNTVLIGCL